MRKSNLSLMNQIIYGIILLLFGILIGIIFPMQAIPLKYIIPTGILLFIILIGLGYLVLKRQTNHKKRVCLLILELLLIFILSMIYYYLTPTLKFMNHISAKEYQLEDYYILVLKDSTYQELIDLKNKTLATYEHPIASYEKELSTIKNKIDINDQKYSNYLEACQALLNGQVESLLLSSSYKSIVDEELTGFKDRVRILGIEQIKMESQIETANINVQNDSFHIYVSGIDIYGDISLVSRSDVNMIITVNPTAHQILLTSIPRDYYVTLHGTTGYKDKLTHSGIYGIHMTVQTIEDLLDIQIPYYIRVNFNTLVELVDEIGGVDVYSDTAFQTSCSYQVGYNHLDGKCALAYARERYVYQSGDRHRIQNQQEIVKSILISALSSKNLITKYPTILNNLSNSFQTNIPYDKMYTMLNKQLEMMPTWQIEQISLNGADSSNYTYTYPYQKLYVMEPDVNTIEESKQKITEVTSLS